MTGKIRIGLKTLLIVGLGLILTGCFSRSILVSFESNGGTPLRDVLVPLGDVLEKPDDPKKEGYVFEGWFIDIDLTTEYEFDEPVEKDMTLYAKWNPAKYIITWETNGGSSLEPTEVNYKATIVAPQTPTREGYVFTGWFYEVELKTQFNFQTTMPAKDFTLYAGWEKGQYNITFNTNGGLEVDPIIGIFGEEFDEPVTNRFGYTFQGWYLEPEFENEFTEFVIPSQDITLYAKWEPNDIEVTIFIYEGQSETKIVKYNEILDVLSTPVRTGYTFKGWIDAESGEPFDFSKPIRESVTISAEWERNTYTVTFETTGGNPLAPQEVSYDSLLSEPPKPTKTGHDFGGWFKDVELSVAWDFANDKVTENITLYAKWEPKTYRISFVNADTAQMEFKYGAPLCAPDDPTRVGHTFSGWYLESTFKTEFTFTGTMPAENKTLYAKWTINDYQLIFKVDGEIYETKLIPYGSNITETPDPKKVGYTFSHWEDLPETMPANDVTVNAIFTVNSYTIIYLVDGIEHDAVSVVYGAEITLLVEPTKVGYTFSGWSEAPVTMPAEDIIVSGHFTVNNYELTVSSSNSNRGSVNVDPSESPVAYNREVTVTAIPKQGYIFYRWTDGTKTVSTQATYNFIMPANDLTLTAEFTPESNVGYKISYYGESLDGTSYEVLYSTTLFGTTEAEVSAEERDFEGFTFDSDHLDNILVGNILGDGSLELKVYYTRNTYTLTYKVDGTEYFVKTFKYEEEITAPVDPVKIGHQFDRWDNVLTTMPANDVTVNAIFTVNSYTIIYLVDGIEHDAVSVVYGAEITLLVEPTKVGYTFSGWSEAPVTMPAEDIIVSGHFTVNNYELTVLSADLNKGSVNVDPSESPVAYNREVTVTAIPESGYIFSHWTDGSITVSDKATYVFIMPANDLTLTAFFVPESNVGYKISYYGESLDGTSYEVLYSTTLFGTTEAEVSAEERDFEGFTFDSDHLDNILVGNILGDGSLELKVYYTRNTYTLTYKVDGTEYFVKTFKYEEEITAPVDPVKIGHQFDRWDNVLTTMPANDVTVNAIFTVNSYTIIYLVDGIEHDAVSVVYGAEITLLVEPTKVGYTFSGWSEAPATMPAEDIIVSGHFTVNNYELTVSSSNSNRGSVNVDPSESPVAYNREVTVTAIPKQGYIFYRWTDGTKTVSTQATYNFIMPANDLTLTAFFVPESNVGYKISYYGESLDGTSYEVLYSTTLFGSTEAEVSAEERDFEGFTFDSDHLDNILVGNILGDGSLELKVYYTRNTYTLTYKVDGTEYFVKTFKYGEEITAPVDPVKIGYQFNGWINLPETMPAEDFSVAANFSIIEYSLTYQLNGGKFSHQQQVKYNIMSNFQIANPIREGYTFLGWTFMGQVEPIKDFKINPGRTGDLDLVANWKAIDYSIHYFDGGDSLNLEPNTYTIEGLVILPIKEKIGYNFLGWYDNSEFVGEVITEIPVGSLGDKSFYAKYEVITYTITYYDENWQPLNNSDLITEYTYDENEDLPLVLLPANIGIAFVWEDASGNYYLKVSAGTVGNLELKATYIPIVNDVSFYNENGVLIGTLYNVPYGTEISLEAVFAGKPEFVQKLLELNLTIISCQMSDPFDYDAFSSYFMANYEAIAATSSSMNDAVSTVLTEGTPESILALMASADSELARLTQALNIKINLLQDLKLKIQAVIEVLGEEAQEERATELYAFVYATKGALTSFSEELTLAVNQWLSSMGSDNEAFELMNGLTNMELTNAAVLRQTYRKNHPTKNGYAFIGWRLGTESYYLTYEPGYVFEGKSAYAPASGVSGEAAKLIAYYRRLQGLEATFTANTNRLEWMHLSSEVLATLYDEATETIDVEYDIYIEDQEGNLYYYISTIDNRIVLEYLGTYKVKVIPVIKVYENGELINTVSASISNAIGKEVTVTKKEDQAVLESSGNYYHKMTEDTGTVFYFFSNTEITFPDSQFTILSGSEYVTVKNNNTLVFGNLYTTEDQEIEFTFTSSVGGAEYLGRIYPYVSQYELGENLTHYMNITDNIEKTLYYDEVAEPYYVGKALIGADENDVLNNDNAFYFDLLIKTTGGKKIELPASYLDFKAFEIVGGGEQAVTISNNTSGDWQIYRDGKHFFFRESGKTYKVEIDIKDPFVPRKLKEDGIITKKAFIITINDGINVFTNEELQIAYANTLVKGINVHRNIEAKLNSEQTYVDPDDGITYPYNYGAGSVISLYNNGLAYKVGNVYQRISPADVENKDNLVINGNYFTIDGSKLPYTNYAPGDIGITLPGGTKLPQPGALPTIPGYKIRNVQISIFKHISVDTTNPAKVNYGGVTYNNLTVIGNTQTPNISYSEGASDIEEALEVMGRNSGGYVAISNSNNTTLAVDNVVIGSSTIAIWSSDETEVIVTNAHLYNSWANTIYGYGIASLSVSNAVLETSGGAAIHIEDTKFSSDYAQTIYFDSETIEVNNWVSGEEPWFKAYSMEFAAMQLKAKINSGVRAALNASILRTIKDPSSDLKSNKMNFTMLILPVAEQLNTTEAIKGEIPIDKHTTPNYSDITVYVLQSGDWYSYDGPYEGKHLVPLSEGLFYQIAQQQGQEYNSVVLPLGEQRSLVLESGISELGTNIYTNFLAVQADMTSVSRGHAIVLLGLDNVE